MIIRVVKMTFQEKKVDTFLDLFEQTKDQIRGFPGCKHLELWQDTHDPRVFFTYSHWEKQQDLARYRESPLFRTTWQQTKILFEEKPQAWSLKRKSLS